MIEKPASSGCLSIDIWELMHDHNAVYEGIAGLGQDFLFLTTETIISGALCQFYILNRVATI